VQAFEHEFAELVGVKHAIAVASGTAGLHLAYVALGLESGDEVVQPALSFVAAANMTVAVGATPVFADIVSLEEPTVDPADVEARVTPRTKAVVVMHYGGYPCRMAEIREVCARRGLALVEDACHAVGARYLDPTRRPPHGRMAGNLGDIACFSFFSNKNLATGEGGMVVTDTEELADRVRLLRSHGMTSLTWERHKGHASSYDVVEHGYNYRLDEIRAALGRAQLAKLAEGNEARKERVLTYRQNLTDLPDWIVPFWDYLGGSSYHLMPLVAPDERARLQVVEALREARIQTSLHYPCICGFRAFARFPAPPLGRTWEFAKRVVTLPLFPRMTIAQVDEVCRIIRHTDGTRTQ